MPQPISYPGVHAHLNSHLQTEPGGWASFHSEHIIDIRRAITANLPAGYYARAEKSLQIGESVSDREDNPTAITVYKVREDEGPAYPVTHIELMSPANKGRSPYAAQYAAKRQTTLRSGIHLVEIDYLHHLPPLLSQMPDYTPGDPDATPYNVLVSDVRHAETQIYEVGVLDKLPTLALPLADVDHVRLDLNATYQRTVGSLDGLAVDLSAFPPAFERYTERDQQALRALLDR